MTRFADLFLTALAPAIWGSTYIVTTEFLPLGHPVTVALLRALPAGVLLLLIVRQLPSGIWWGRIFLLGALNFTVFWSLLFVSAYRLPGGVAATLGAVQPLMVIFLARALLGTMIRVVSVIAAISGAIGVAFLILSPEAALDPLGLLAGIGGAASMAAGTVLSRKWQPPVSLLTFTAWQLTAGGILLLPLAVWFEPSFPLLTISNILALTYLSVIGAALTYVLWFRGIQRIEPSSVAPLGFFSPLTAVLLGWLALGQTLTQIQFAGVLIVLGSVWLSQLAGSSKIGLFSTREKNS
jgi:probable blue pigment (indigoidine) exporter